MSKAHRFEVCGLQWSPDGSRLASGGNDNMVCIWNASDPSEPFKVLRGHQAAVKVSWLLSDRLLYSYWWDEASYIYCVLQAVSWCPWQTNTLATGGGSNDQNIRFWNTYTGECVNTIDTKSQVLILL